MTRRFTTAGLPMACVLCGRVAAPAAEEILKLVPDSALGFVVINRPAAVDAKLQALGRQMQLPVPSLLAMLKATIRHSRGVGREAGPSPWWSCRRKTTAQCRRRSSCGSGHRLRQVPWAVQAERRHGGR